MWRVKTVTKFKKSFFPTLIYWNDIEIHLGFQHSYLYDHGDDKFYPAVIVSMMIIVKNISKTDSKRF